MAYDDPDYQVRFERAINNLTGIASTAMTRSLFFQTARIKKVHALAITAGTHDSAGVDILVGTTSVGAITIGTSTAGTTYSSGALDATVPALGYVEIKGKANSATMVDSYVIEYQLLPGGVQS